MGRLRSWVIRGLILAGLSGVAFAGWVAHGWVSPEAVRAALVAALREQFPDADVEVGSARLRLFGGVSATDIKLTRRGEAEPFFVAPSAVIHSDKEQLNRGRMVVRKVDLDGPTVRVARRADGTWSLAGLTRPSSPDAPVPTVVVRNATVHVAADGLPPVTLTGARLSLLNDPVAWLKFDAQFTVSAGALAVPVAVSAKLNRYTNTVKARVEVPELAFGPELAPALARLDPQLAEYAAAFTANLKVTANLTTNAESGRKLEYDVEVQVREGRWEDADLPWPMEHITATVRAQDGRVTVEKASARLGKAAVEWSLETRPLAALGPPPVRLYGPRARYEYSVLSTQYPALSSHRPPAPAGDPLREIEDKLERLDVTVRDLALDDELFARLPPKIVKGRRMFSPTGTVDLAVRFARAPGGWRREIDLRPNRLAIVYEEFRYPTSDLTGSVKRVTTSDGIDEVRVQLTGSAGGRRVEMSGKVGTGGDDPLIDLKIAGTDIPIDAKLFAALPPRYAESLGKLHATGRADFVVDVRQPQDVNRCESTFRVRMYDGAVNYDLFPYPMARVKGHVLVRVAASNPARPLRPGQELAAVEDADRVEFREFEAVHAGGRLWLNGDSEPVPNSRDRRLALRILGEACPIDADLKAAMATLKLDGAWRTFAPRGKLTFGADVEVIDRAEKEPFDPATDLKLTFNFRGPSATPTFFPYELDDLAGVLRFQAGKVDLARFTARHGDAHLTVDAAEVRFAAGETWANVGGLTLRPLIPDAALLAAMPARLRTAFEELKLRGPMDLTVKHLVVKAPKTPSAPEASARVLNTPSLTLRAPTATDPDPVLYWNAELRLAGASLDTGLAWTNVYGSVASVGLYDSTHLGAVLGNAWFDRATIAKQPVTAAKLSFRVRPQEADPLRPGGFTPPVIEFPDLTGTLYQGTVGGEARVVLDDAVRYRLWLTASGVRLDELARECKLAAGGELRGLAQGKLLVENTPDPRTGALALTGVGQIDIPTGRMYKLGVLLPLLKLLKLQTPDETAFEEAHAVFELKGDRVKVSQLDLIGTAVSLGGSGEATTDGSDVRFEFYTVWSQALKRWLTTPLGDVTSFLSGNLFKIEMVKRANGEMTYHPHMLPVVTDPARAIAERLRNRLGRAPEAPTVRATGPR